MIVWLVQWLCVNKIIEFQSCINIYLEQFNNFICKFYRKGVDWRIGFLGVISGLNFIYEVFRGRGYSDIFFGKGGVVVYLVVYILKLCMYILVLLYNNSKCINMFI